MRHTRRRKRTLDPLASPNTVTSVLEVLRHRLPDLIPHNDKDLKSMLHAVRNHDHNIARDTSRGRPSRWSYNDLNKVSSTLKSILEKQGLKISNTSFINYYLPILDYPTDIIEALTSGTINLFEAAQLVRLSPDNLDLTCQQVRRKRQEILKAHLQSQESGMKLRLRVRKLLGEESSIAHSKIRLDKQTRSLQPKRLNNESSAGHLFFDQLQLIGSALEEIHIEDLSQRSIKEILDAGDKWFLAINRAKKAHKQSLRQYTSY